MIIIPYINIIILLILGFIHISWAMGGTKGMSVAIPKDTKGKPLFKPGMLGALFVAMALICFAYFHYSYIHASPEVKKITGYLLLAGYIVFFVRAIGDFKYSGFFKKVRNTKFARNDTWFYSPLCLLIAVLGFINYFYN